MRRGMAPGLIVTGDPAAQAYVGRPGALDALMDYDARNEPERVALVCMPDLVHPRAGGGAREPELSAPAPTLRFGRCDAEPVLRAEPVVAEYPKLAWDGRAEELRSWQRRLRESCEGLGDRAAMLDLPPDLGPAEALPWRESMASARVALYAPWLRVVRAEDPSGPLVDVPASAAAWRYRGASRAAGRRVRSAGQRAGPRRGCRSWGTVSFQAPARSTRRGSTRSDRRRTGLCSWGRGRRARSANGRTFAFGA